MSLRWRKSSYSGNGGNCAEVARPVPGAVAIRDSKNRGGGALTFPMDEWRAFAARVRAGELDQG